MSVAEKIERPRRVANDAPTAPHVIRAINAVSAELAKEGISKSRNNQQQGYKFRGIDEVLNALSMILADQGLVIIPHVETREVTERLSVKGNPLFYVVIRAHYTFISAEDGSRETVGPFDGEAMDSADKATNKAMSAAYKYMAIQTFCIPTEGDNDADATTHEVVAAAGEVRPSSPPRQPPPSSASAKREGTWERFVERCRSFTDLDALERWWSNAETQKAIDAMPGTWPEQAHEEYEKAQERLLNAGRP